MKIFKQEAVVEGTFYYAFLCGVISFLLVLVALFLLYVVCSKRYRLNWFEKDLLEKAKNKELTASQDVLCDVTASEVGSLYDVPVEDKFWVPGKKTDENLDSPSTPADSKASNYSPDGLSLCSGLDQDNTLQPIARSDKHVVLSTANPVRPRVSSMNAKLSHSKIDTSLYPKEPCGSKPEEEPLGSVRISVSYDPDPAAGILSVRLIEACGLVPRDLSGTADPYAKIRLLPDRDNVWQTRVDKKTLNPVFDEDFVFEVRPSSISYRTLEIILYDFDAYSRHHSLGGVKINLFDLDLSQKITIWKNLGRCAETDSKAELGSLMVSLTFLPNAERLTAVIGKARNLRMVDDSRTTTDAFVKACLVHGSKRLKKKKTSVQKNTINPVFNEHLTFDVNKEVLSQSSIEFWVYHENKLGPCEPIGKAVVGHGNCSPQEKQFFQEILTSKTAVTRWLELKDPDEKF